MTATDGPVRAARRAAPLSPPDRVRAVAAGRQTMRWLAILLPCVLVLRPTLESAQVAVWLWTLVGLTLGLVAVSRRAVQPA